MTCHDIILSVSNVNLELYVLQNNICYMSCFVSAKSNARFDSTLVSLFCKCNLNKIGNNSRKLITRNLWEWATVCVKIPQSLRHMAVTIMHKLKIP